MARRTVRFTAITVTRILLDKNFNYLAVPNMSGDSPLTEIIKEINKD